MIWLGLAVCIAYVPGWIGASVPTGWAVLSCFLPLTLWRPVQLSAIHLALPVTYGWALTQPFIVGGTHSVWGLWLLGILFLAIHFGTTLQSLRPIFRGAAIGMSISSAIAIFQALGWDPVLHFGPRPAGLFFNSTVQGLMISFLIIGLSLERDWAFIPAMLPGLYLAHSRGSLVVLGVGFFAMAIRRPFWLLAAALLGLSLAMRYGGSSDIERLFIWRAAIDNLHWLGRGPGSFLEIYYARSATMLVHPEYVHNDYLQFVYELGIGAAPLLAAFVACFFSSTARYWPLYAAAAVSAAFVFPVHIPATLLILGLATGHCARGWGMAWGHLGDWRRHLILWTNPQQSQSNPARS